jgi:uncharacterized protein (TIGR02996 family)
VTGEFEALVAALLDDPLDEAHRLVLADWLRDHGRDEDADVLLAAGLLEVSTGPPTGWGAYSPGWQLYYAARPGPRYLALAPLADRQPACPFAPRVCGGTRRVFLFGQWWCWACASREAMRRKRDPDPPLFENVTWGRY